MSAGHVVPSHAMDIFLATAFLISSASTLPVSLVGNGRSTRPRTNVTSQDAAGMPKDVPSGAWEGGRIAHATSPKSPSDTARTRTTRSRYHTELRVDTD